MLSIWKFLTKKRHCIWLRIGTRQISAKWIGKPFEWINIQYKSGYYPELHPWEREQLHPNVVPKTWNFYPLGKPVNQGKRSIEQALKQMES